MERGATRSLNLGVYTGPTFCAKADKGISPGIIMHKHRDKSRTPVARIRMAAGYLASRDRQCRLPKKLLQVRSLQKAGPCWPQAGKILRSQRRSNNVRSVNRRVRDLGRVFVIGSICSCSVAVGLPGCRIGAKEDLCLHLTYTLASTGGSRVICCAQERAAMMMPVWFGTAWYRASPA